jgi:hypothetical protein
MSGLAAFQQALAGAVSGRVISFMEQAILGDIALSPGLDFTAEVRRSWCKGRASKAAYLTLSILPHAERRDLVTAWVNGGGGREAFAHNEADAFLAFIASVLPNPSHALVMCHLERALNAARLRSLEFVPPCLDNIVETSALRRAEDAAVIELFAPLEMLVAAIDGKNPLPPVGRVAQSTLIVAPGVQGLSRPIIPAERALWDKAGSSVTVDNSCLEMARILVGEGILCR